MVKNTSKTTELKVTACSENPPFVIGSFFNGLEISKDTKFDIYQNKHNPDTYALHGENNHLEYNGSNEEQQGNSYIVALYDPELKSIELHPAPMVSGSVTSLKNRVHKGPKIKLRGLRNHEQRIALGQAFGTKKAKAAIANVAKNRIDSEGLQDMELDIVDNVKEFTSELPTRELLETSDSAERPMPVANEDATVVEDIYTLDSIIPKKEWNSIRVGTLMEEEDGEKRMELMAYSKSTFVAKNLPKFVSTGNETKVKMLYYASLLFGVYSQRRARDKTSLMERLDNKPSELLIDGVLDRFAVSRTTAFGKSKDRSFAIDPYHEDKLLCFLLALVFHIEGFLVEILPLAHELNMSPARLGGLFKAMGATIKPVTVSMAETLGLSKKEAATYKVATLRVPFKLPGLLKRGGRG